MFDGDFEVVGHAGGQPDRVRVGSRTRRCSDCSRSKASSGPSPAAESPSTRPGPGSAPRPGRRPDRRRRVGYVDAAARHVAVETDLNVDPQRVGAAALARGRDHALSSAVTRCALSIEWAVCAQRATDRALFRWIMTHHVPAAIPPHPRAPSRQQPSDFGHFRRSFLIPRFANARQPNRDKVTTSVAGKNLVIGRSSISPTLRPAASAAAARRDRTDANAGSIPIPASVGR